MVKRWTHGYFSNLFFFSKFAVHKWIALSAIQLLLLFFLHFFLGQVFILTITFKRKLQSDLRKQEELFYLMIWKKRSIFLSTLYSLRINLKIKVKVKTLFTLICLQWRVLIWTDAWTSTTWIIKTVRQYMVWSLRRS